VAICLPIAGRACGTWTSPTAASLVGVVTILGIVDIGVIAQPLPLPCPARACLLGRTVIGLGSFLFIAAGIRRGLRTGFLLLFLLATAAFASTLLGGG